MTKSSLGRKRFISPTVPYNFIIKRAQVLGPQWFCVGNVKRYTLLEEIHQLGVSLEILRPLQFVVCFLCFLCVVQEVNFQLPASSIPAIIDSNPLEPYAQTQTFFYHLLSTWCSIRASESNQYAGAPFPTSPFHLGSNFRK